MTIDLMEERGTLVFTRTSAPGAGQTIFAITPGSRNDGFGDALRDAFSAGPSRGCHPMNYKPVFWPLFFAWAVLASLRAFRVRQAVWASR